ncbi:hypothetical protein [Streptomyces sp. NPDC060194]|uniref:hypothetical protein n=1 Tax=Streptomyces sp. NPDC060194 TaxID=3347069 RepID=UPI003667D316
MITTPDVDDMPRWAEGRSTAVRPAVALPRPRAVRTGRRAGPVALLRARGRGVTRGARASRGAAALLLCAGAALAGCSSGADGPQEQGYGGPTLPARSASDPSTKWEEGPSAPATQKPYPFDINTHCGIKWVRFGDRWWVLDTVFPGVEHVRGERPDPYDQRIEGYMTLIDPKTANFDAAGLPTMQFVPAKEDPPGCA